MVHVMESQFVENSPSAQPTKIVNAEDAEMMEYSTAESSADDCDSCESSIERTASQQVARGEIQGVLERLEQRKISVQELLQSVATLNRDGHVEALLDAEQHMIALKKQARNLGEDLLEDVLVLDKFSGLNTEDRSNRKIAIAGIEALLENVDISKARLGSLSKEIEAALEVARKEQDQDIETQQSAALHHVENAQTLKHGQRSKAGPPSATASPQPRMANSSEFMTSPKAPTTSPRSPMSLVPPDNAFWERLTLPVDFHSRQERGSYAILAAVPNLKTEKFKMDVSDDQRSLTITGLCVPTGRSAEQMRGQVAQHLQRLARTSPKQLQQLSSDLDTVVAHAYAELGECRYGRFSQVVDLAANVDAQRIKACFEDGVLRITLPRNIRHETHPMMTARHRYGHSRSTGLFGHPAFGW